MARIIDLSLLTVPLTRSASNIRCVNSPCTKYGGVEMEDYEVKIPSDPMVGYPPANVPYSMNQLASDIDIILSEITFLWSVNEQIINRSGKLLRTIEMAAAFRVFFGNSRSHHAMPPAGRNRCRRGR
jgi:hypothetical protein